MEHFGYFWVNTIYGLYRTKDWINSFFQNNPSMDETIGRLENVREQVCKREEILRKKMEHHRALAKKYAKLRQVREARMEIRLRLLYDSQVSSVQKTLTAIESHLIHLQSASLNREVFLALHDSSRALNGGIQDEDMVDVVLEKLEDQHEQTQQIMDLINTVPLDVNSLAEDDIENELNYLMDNDDDNSNTKIPSLPQVPSSSIEINHNTENEAIVGDSI